MSMVKFVTLFAFIGVPANVAFGDHQVGSTVVVIHDAPIKVGDKVVQQVLRGVGLKVLAVQGDWLWVSHKATGWIRKQDVATPNRAIEVFTEEIKKNPYDSDAHVCRGLAWFDKNEIDIAIADLNQAIRLDPKNSSAYSSRSICWWAKRDIDKAISDCTEAIRIEPTEAMHYANRGLLWNMKAEYEKAIADADQAIRIAPDFATPHIVRGKALANQSQYSRALADFDVAIELNSRNAAAYGLRGRVYAARGEYGRAIADFDRALSLDSGNQYVCNELARFYATCPVEKYRNGRKAVEFAERACELSGWEWPAAIAVLAAAHAESGDFDKAVAWQTKAAEMVAPKRRAEYRERLQLYKSGRPYRQEPHNLIGSPARPVPSESDVSSPAS